MQSIRKALKRSLILALLFSALFVFGIPSIVLGAVNSIWALMGVGIGATVVGFYGCPFAWLNYANKRALYRLASAVVEEHIYTVRELSSQLSLSERSVRRKLSVCFKKRYLTGFIREGDRLLLNENAALSEILRAAVCPHCGAKFSYRGTQPQCPYCGIVQNTEK